MLSAAYQEDYGLDLVSEIAKNISRALIRKKEEVVSKAISDKLGDDWVLADVVNRCRFTINPDEIEVFSFDGEDLIRFYPPTFTFNSKNEVEYKVNYELISIK